MTVIKLLLYGIVILSKLPYFHMFERFCVCGKQGLTFLNWSENWYN